jgi:hypothetical protein
LSVTDLPNDEYCGTELTSAPQTVTVRVQYFNRAPTIEVTSSINANEGSLVILHASAADVDGNPLTWNWTQLSGPAVTLDLLDPANPTFIAPQVGCGAETLSFKAVVSDEFGGSAEASISTTIANVNNRPVADAGANQSVTELAPVLLDARASSDSDGEGLTFGWSQTGGPDISLDNLNSPTPAFYAPLVSAGGDPNATVTLTFAVTVTDACGDGAMDVVEVKVTNLDHAPIASAGGSQSRCEGDFVTLNGVGSSDPDGDSLTYSWTQIAGPAVTLSDATTAAPTFRAPHTGAGGDTLVFGLTVSDGFGGSSTDTATIALLNCNTPPNISNARASETILWPPNHSLQPITILGVQDPENNATITITSVTQDEPINGTGDGDTGPDAVLRGSSVLLRAERNGNGTGRVYHIHFTASDPEGSASGIVTVRVPRNKKTEAVTDEGELHLSGQ